MGTSRSVAVPFPRHPFVSRPFVRPFVRPFFPFAVGAVAPAVVWDPTFPPAALQLGEVERAARVLNLELQPVEVRAAEAPEAAVRAVVAQRTQALLVMPALFTEQRRRLAALATQQQLPTMLHRREFVEAGGLMSYFTNYSDMYRRAATYVDKILKGSKPADLPVEQPTKFELMINLKTAKALGLTIPQTVLLRADHVIE